MNQPVVIVDQAATYRAGLARAVADAGFAPVHTDDPEEWAATPGPRSMLYTARRPEDWKSLCSVTDVNPELVVVALVVDATPEAYAEAFRCGARGAVAWEAEPDTIVKVLQAAEEELCLLPVTVTRALCRQIPVTGSAGSPTPEELRWLRELAAGASMCELARQEGYSERTFYRLLRSLYRRMGVSNRAEALQRANVRSPER